MKRPFNHDLFDKTINAWPTWAVDKLRMKVSNIIYRTKYNVNDATATAIESMRKEHKELP